MNRNIIFAVIAVAGVGIIIAGFIIFTGFNPGLSDEQIAKNAIDYINNNGLAQSSASLVSVSEESGLVKIKIKIGDNEFDSYATKDGKLLFPTALKISKKTDNSQNANNQPSEQEVQKTCDAMQKTEKPLVEAYVVSGCPYGLQMQRAMADAVENIPELAQNMFVRYIGAVSGGKITSMHGDEEAQENLRQICIRDEQRSKYWKYVSCYIKAGDTSGCITSAGIDKNKLNACAADSNRGLAYAKEDFGLNEKYSVQGSPTLILGGTRVDESGFGGRSSEGVKKIICCSSSSELGFCSTKLNTADAAVSFSQTYEGSNKAPDDETGNTTHENGGCAPAQ